VTADIAARLREIFERAGKSGVVYPQINSATVLEAAVEIERLRNEVARLQKRGDDWYDQARFLRQELNGQ